MGAATAECEHCVRVTCMAVRYAATEFSETCDWQGYRLMDEIARGCPNCFHQVFYIESVHHRGPTCRTKTLNDLRGKEEQ